MIKIRQGVFETNSSSTHAMVICSKADYEKLERGEMYIDAWGEEPVTKEEVIKRLSKYYDREELEAMNEDDFLEIVMDNGFYTLDYWREDLNDFKEEFTTEHGDEIVVFGRYGFDG